jgi:hypothetical protein
VNREYSGSRSNEVYLLATSHYSPNFSHLNITFLQDYEINCDLVDIQLRSDRLCRVPPENVHFLTL